MTDANSLEQVARAQKGDADAAGELFTKYYPSIYRFLYYRTGDAQTAEDLTGETFLRMVQVLPSFRPTNVPFQAWLYQIARNLSIDYHRRKNGRIMVEMDDNLDGEDPELQENVETKLTQENLKKALSQIGDIQKDVIILRFVEGLSTSDVAFLLHRSEDSIKALQRRGLAALRQTLITLEESSYGRP